MGNSARLILSMPCVLRYSILLLTLLSTVSLSAHQDLLGDVHPGVDTSTGEFQVYYENNVRHNYFKITVSKEGVFKALPKQVEADAYHDARAKSTVGWDARDGFSKKKVTEFISSTGAKMSITNTVTPLLYRNKGKDLLVISSRYEEDGNVCALQYISKTKTENVITQYLGDVSMIMSSPTCSKAIEINGLLYLAWLDGKSSALKLSSWDIKTRKLTTVVLKKRVNSNTSISIGNIGKTILVAYHGFPGDAETGRPRIQTVIHRIGKPKKEKAKKP